MAEDTQKKDETKKEKDDRGRGLMESPHSSEAFQDKDLAEKGIYQPFDKVSSTTPTPEEESEEDADHRKNRAFLGRPVPSESAGAASQAK